MFCVCHLYVMYFPLVAWKHMLLLIKQQKHSWPLIDLNHIYGKSTWCDQLYLITKWRWTWQSTMHYKVWNGLIWILYILYIGPHKKMSRIPFLGHRSFSDNYRRVLEDLTVLAVGARLSTRLRNAPSHWWQTLGCKYHKKRDPFLSL